MTRVELRALVERLGTLKAIARRGIQPETITQLMVEIGIKMSDSAISWKKIYGLINEHYSEVVANSEEHHWPPQIVCSSIDWKAAFNCLKNNDRIS